MYEPLAGHWSYPSFGTGFHHLESNDGQIKSKSIYISDSNYESLKMAKKSVVLFLIIYIPDHAGFLLI